MAFVKSGKLPKDAVQIDEAEAATYMWDIVTKWKNTSDTWALRFGAIALGTVSSITGIVINRHYRWKFKLGDYAFFSSAIPIVVMPGILTIVFHKYFANRYSTYRIPPLTDGPKVMFNFLRKHTTKSLTGPLAYLAVLQLAASATVTYYEMKNNLSLKRKLRAIEKKLDEDLYN
ncbi:unnamed protein product [Danaus chrysippus]|uniref:(African queen) hypothetical protein n=1 Tax=Danaus chrysippus TaxID=151541 RepID=A0A8J2R2P9_9NEOP|nr:unnamed protein product [Danaus chrysippus]